MIGGTNSVEMIIAKMMRLPRNSIRASAYAAGAAVTSTTTPIPSAAITEFRNQRKTGVWAVEEKIVSNASVLHSDGRKVGGTAADSSSDLNAVRTIQMIGDRNSSVRATSPR